MTRFVWPAMFGVAVLTGTWITEHRSKNRALARKGCLFGLTGGILGARAWYSAQYGIGSSGMSCYGFIAGVVVVGALYWRFHAGRTPMGDVPDAAAPAILLGGALVRIGCFIHGCCYGKPSNLPWAVSYGPATPAYRSQLDQALIQDFAPSSLPVHPTQFYEALFAAALGVIMLIMGRNLRLPRHCLCLLTVALYAVFRFFVEFIRGDAGGFYIGPLTFAQATSVIVLATALAVMSWRIRVEAERT